MWESQIQALMRRGQRRKKAPPTEPATYESTLHEVVFEMNNRLNWDYKDAQARAKALWEIVEREKALAKQEKNDARRRASRERKARIAAGEEVEPVGGKFERHLEEKRRMWPPVGSVRQRRIDARAARLAAAENGDQLSEV
jgi:hypothetical protein